MAAVSTLPAAPVRTSFSRPAQTAVFSIQPPIAPSSTKPLSLRSSTHSHSAPHTSRPTRQSRDATIEAIAKFKPTPRDVISGIAPHVFDERRRRRSQKRASRRSWCETNGLVHIQSQKRSSPLRRTTVLSLEEHSIYLEHSASKASLASEPLNVDVTTTPCIMVGVPGSGTVPSRPPSLTDAQPPVEIHLQRPTPISDVKTHPVKGLDRSTKRHQFRIDSEMFRTLIVKFRFSRFRSMQ